MVNKKKLKKKPSASLQTKRKKRIQMEDEEKGFPGRRDGLKEDSLSDKNMVC